MKRHEMKYLYILYILFVCLKFSKYSNLPTKKKTKKMWSPASFSHLIIGARTHINLRETITFSLHASKTVPIWEYPSKKSQIFHSLYDNIVLKGRFEMDSRWLLSREQQRLSLANHYHSTCLTCNVSHTKRTTEWIRGPENIKIYVRICVRYTFERGQTNAIFRWKLESNRIKKKKQRRRRNMCDEKNPKNFASVTTPNDTSEKCTRLYVRKGVD